METVIKDGDSNSLSILQADFPSIRNVLDKNHYIKNIPFHMKAAVKTRKAPALRGRHTQIQQQINRILGVVHRYQDRDVSWRKLLFANLGQQMVAHLCGDHRRCPSSTGPPPPSAATEFMGYTSFRDEWIGLNWRCHIETDEFSQNLVPSGQPKSQKAKHKIIQCGLTRNWLHSYIAEQADREEIMWHGSSNKNESINSKYAVKASKRVDFR